MKYLILILYSIATFGVGWAVVRRWFFGLPLLLSAVGALLLGVLVIVSTTYIFTVLFAKTGEPMLWGTVTAVLLCLGCAGFSLKHKHVGRHLQRNTISLNDALLLLCSLLFSTWLMTKTFHGDAAGQIFVGSNNVFDFGMNIGLVRSMSWGANFPFASPFFAGAPMLYHFFFNFWVAQLEYFGIPIEWAVNIPGILSFAAFLAVVYYLPQIVARQKPLVGWVAVLLTITNSSLTFWRLLAQKGMSFQFVKDLWNVPAYPFAGPFDGSVISIFVTLNNYVNQRHLSYAIAVGLFLYIGAVASAAKFKRGLLYPVIFGLLTGMLFGWNMIIYLFTIALICGWLVIHRAGKAIAVYVICSVALGGVFLLPMASWLVKAGRFLGHLVTATGGRAAAVWEPVEYLWENLGVLPIVAGAGFLLLPRKTRRTFFPFVIGFLLLCLFAVVTKSGFEQKSYSFFIISINTLAAIVLVGLWKHKKVVAKLAGILICGVLVVSGIVDLFPIKNEFAYPLVQKDMIPLITWIRHETPRDAVFVSYSDMIDPVVLAGRSNYFGFFGNVGWSDRSGVVWNIYDGNMGRAKALGISHVLVPKWQKNDFPYMPNIQVLATRGSVAYEDEKYLIFSVR